VESTLPKLTAILTGPSALFLTNAGSFEAECVISLGSGEKPRKLSGRLFVRGGKLSLETVPAKSKSANTGAFGVIWDATSGNGFVFSEALQGYAAIGAEARSTNSAIVSIAGPGNFPLEIRSAASPDVFALALAKVQRVLPPDDLFLPPDGFTKYPNAAALLNELTDRQQSVLGEHEPSGPHGGPGETGEQSGYERTYQH
jgi:hypothetical protein